MKDYQVRIEEDGEDERVEVFENLADAELAYQRAIDEAYEDVVNNSIHIELIEVFKQHCVDPPYREEGA